MHLYFRNKEPVSLPRMQQVMAAGSLVRLNWNVGWVQGTGFKDPDNFKPTATVRENLLGPWLGYWCLKMFLSRYPEERW